MSLQFRELAALSGFEGPPLGSSQPPVSLDAGNPSLSSGLPWGCHSDTDTNV